MLDHQSASDEFKVETFDSRDPRCFESVFGVVLDSFLVSFNLNPDIL